MPQGDDRINECGCAAMRAGKRSARAPLLPTTFAVDARTCANATSSRKRYASKRRKTRREGTAAAGRKIYSISADACSGPPEALPNNRGVSNRKRKQWQPAGKKWIRLLRRQNHTNPAHCRDCLYAKNLGEMGGNFLASPPQSPAPQ